MEACTPLLRWTRRTRNMAEARSPVGTAVRSTFLPLLNGAVTNGGANWVFRSKQRVKPSTRNVGQLWSSGTLDTGVESPDTNPRAFNALGNSSDDTGGKNSTSPFW